MYRRRLGDAEKDVRFSRQFHFENWEDVGTGVSCTYLLSAVG